MADQPMKTIWAASLFGWKTKTGRVDLIQTEEGNDQPLWREQLSINEARSIAMQLLQAAEAAETDEMIFTWLRDVVGVQGDEKIGGALVQFRAIRNARKE